MSATSGKIESEFGGTNAVFDALVARHQRLEDDMAKWRQRIDDDGLILELNNSGLQGNPLLDRVLKAEGLIHSGLRSMWWIILSERKPEEAAEDEFDAYLKEVEATGRPRQRQHGG